MWKDSLLNLSNPANRDPRHLSHLPSTPSAHTLAAGALSAAAGVGPGGEYADMPGTPGVGAAEKWSRSLSVGSKDSNAAVFDSVVSSYVRHGGYIRSKTPAKGLFDLQRIRNAAARKNIDTVDVL